MKILDLGRKLCTFQSLNRFQKFLLKAIENELHPLVILSDITYKRSVQITSLMFLNLRWLCEDKVDMCTV